MSHRKVDFVPTPSPFHSQIMDTNAQGLLAYGSRGTVVVLDIQDKPILRNNFVAHQDKVACLSFCKKNSLLWLATGGEDGHLKVWDLQRNPKVVDTTVYDKKRITAIEFPYGVDDRIFFALGRQLKQYLLFHRRFRSFKCSNDDVIALASCKANTNILAAGHKYGIITLHDTVTLKNTHKIHAHSNDITSLSWCASSSSQLASSSIDGSTKFWTISGGDSTSTVFLDISPKQSTKIKTWVSSVCHPTDPNLLITSSFQGDVTMHCIDDYNTKKTVFGKEAGGHSKSIFIIVVNKYNPNVVITFALDRLITFWDLSQMKSTHQLHNLSLSIQCFEFSPHDNVHLAIGCGDSAIRLWTDTGTSKTATRTSKTAVKNFFLGVRGRVTAVSWHPEKDYLLAFSSDDGRVGFFDISQTTKSAVFFAKRHKSSVYSLAWGPCPPIHGPEDDNAAKLHLYSCGDGRVYVHSLSDLSKYADFETLSTVSMCSRSDMVEGKERRMEICWKADYTLFVVGNDTGKVEVYNRELCLVAVLEGIKKFIQSICWHPQYISLSKLTCQMHCWLAIGSGCPDVFVYDLTKVAECKSSDVLTISSPTCQLKGHMDKICQVSWSSHIEGRLLSAAFDRTVQVWDVISGCPLANFSGHYGRVFAARWSFLDPDVVISGGDDSYLFKWKISEQTEISPPHKKEFGKSQKNKKQDPNLCPSHPLAAGTAKKIAEAAEVDVLASEAVSQELNGASAEPKGSLESKQDDDNSDDEVDDLGSLKAQRSESSTQAPRKFYERHKKYAFFKKLASDMSQKRPEMVADSLTFATLMSEKHDLTTAELSEKQLYLGFFADKASFYRSFENEVQTSLADPYLSAPRIQYALWDGNLKEFLLESAEKGEIHETELTLATMVSRAFWLELCEKYAMQPSVLKIPLKSVMYLLACNKLYEAIDVLKEAGNYRDALGLAKLRLPDCDPLVIELQELYAQKLIDTRRTELAANCYVGMNQPLRAAAVASSRCDISAYHLATHICFKFGHCSEGKQYLMLLLPQALSRHRWDILRECIALDPNLKALSLLIDIHETIEKQAQPETKLGLRELNLNGGPFTQNTVIWKCYEVDGQCYLQHLFSQLDLSDLNKSLMQEGCADMKNLLQQLQQVRSVAESIYAVAVNITLCFLTLCCEEEEAAAKCSLQAVECLNSSFFACVEDGESPFFDFFSEMLFPFDIIWNAEEKRIKLSAVVSDKGGIVEAWTVSLANEVNNLKIFQTQQYLTNVGFIHNGAYFCESNKIEQLLCDLKPWESLLAFLSMNILPKLREQLDLVSNLFPCCHGEVSKTETESGISEIVAESQSDDPATNLKTTSDISKVPEPCDETLVVSNGMGNLSLDESAVKSSSTVCIVHDRCCDSAQLWLQLYKVFAACVCKDIFALELYLKTAKEVVEMSLLSSKAKIRIATAGEHDEAATEECPDVPEGLENVNIPAENSAVTSEEKSLLKLEDRHKLLVVLHRELRDQTKERRIPECVPIVSALIEFATSIRDRIDCPDVRQDFTTFGVQLKLWLQKFIV